MIVGGITNWLVVMVKVPIAGRVKTRLAHDIGDVAATAFYRHTTAAVVQRLSPTRRWQTVLAVAPDIGLQSPVFAHHLPRIAQGSGDLGQRLYHIMVSLPPGPVVIIGSDTPDVTPQYISDAFQALGQHDAVLGPAPDGGYWLIGLKRRPNCPAIFIDVRWSTEHAHADTRANLDGLRVAEIQELPDVDCAADLSALQHPVGRRILPR